MKQILSKLKGVFERLSPDAIRHAAEKINGHSRSFVYGAGRSGLLQNIKKIDGLHRGDRLLR